MILSAEGSTPHMQALAERVLEALTFAYPNHPWGVEVRGDDTGGSIFIRHLDYSGKYGMLLNHKKGDSTFYSASALKREVIMKAGEWLERAGLARKRWDETPHQSVEGVPEQEQPSTPREPSNLALTYADLREVAHRSEQKPKEENGQTGLAQT